MRALLCLSVMVIGLAALCTGAVGAPRGSYVVHEKRDSVPSTWVNLGPVAEDSNLTVRIGLKQSNLDNAHNYLRDMLVSVFPLFPEMSVEFLLTMLPL